MSIMDLSFLSYPELFKKKDLYQLVHWTEYSVKHSKAFLTISEFSRNAIIKQYNYPSERVFVTYPGLIMNKTEGKGIARNRPYILSVGTIQPRKNYEKLIEAFSHLSQDIDLVIVGKKGWLYESILAAPEKFGVKDRVIFLDFVPDEDLPALYANAECFVLASLYEGFGLPVLNFLNPCGKFWRLIRKF
jgi:glycosyltransferase involved in cell wall biosynthesis